MTPSPLPSELLLDALKTRMKSEKISYAILAKKLKLSLPTIKRWLTGRTPLSFSQFAQVSEAIEFDFWELIECAKPARNPIFTFTPEQEELFAREPHYFAFFESFVRESRSTEKIRSEAGISARAVRKYLDKLQMLGLVRQTAKGEWVSKVRGTLIWDDHGPMGRRFSSRQVSGLAQRAVREKLKNGQLWLNGWKMTEESFNEFKTDMETLRQKFRERSQWEARTQKMRVKVYTFTAIIDQWEDDLLRRIIEI